MKKFGKLITCSLVAVLASVAFAGCGADGVNGKDGANGKDGVNGVDGKTPVFQLTDEGIFQWKYEGEEEWKNIIDKAELKGDKGDTGATGAKGEDGQNVEVIYVHDGVNFFNKDDAGFVYEKRLNTDNGKIVDPDGTASKYAVSHKIAYKPGSTFSWKTFGIMSQDGKNSTRISCYDKDDVFLGSYDLKLFAADGSSLPANTSSAAYASFVMPTDGVALMYGPSAAKVVPAYFRISIDGRTYADQMVIEGTVADYIAKYEGNYKPYAEAPALKVGDTVISLADLINQIKG